VSLRSASTSGLVPVFPLPGVVFFPRTILPLHVFEPRYRAMVRDATSGEGLIAVSLLRPGWESDYAGTPAFYDVGTVGRIEDLEPVQDGRYNLRLVGVQRVLFGEIVQDQPYRIARVIPLEETAVEEEEPRILSGKLDLLASHGCLLRELTEHETPTVVLDERIPFETAVNGACANLPVDPALRQALLEEDQLMRRFERASDLLNEVLERVLHLKALRSADEGGTGLN
jgi:Lon protease-like protein